jgi:hypothetical protein
LRKNEAFPPELGLQSGKIALNEAVKAYLLGFRPVFGASEPGFLGQ